ncbi:hypothetical protein C8J56DRAFT_1157991 [Mycena floridula]|nr:hypothetical protein C8J56DRAFT_1157991 [Mycena floridula]
MITDEYVFFCLFNSPMALKAYSTHSYAIDYQQFNLTIKCPTTDGRIQFTMTERVPAALKSPYYETLLIQVLRSSDATFNNGPHSLLVSGRRGITEPTSIPVIWHALHLQTSTMDAGVALAVRSVDNIYAVAMCQLYYDHVLTFDAEVEYVWRKPVAFSSLWFLMNRYIAFFGNVPVVLLTFSQIQPKSCSQYILYHQVLMLTSQAIVCCIMILRVYALYSRDIRMLLFMLTCFLVLLGVSCWALVGQHNDKLTEISGCHFGTSVKTAIHLATPWEALGVFDAIVFAATLIKTCRDRHWRLSDGLFNLFLRDGAIYFAGMGLANVSNIVTLYVVTQPVMRGALSTFSSSVSVTMCSRLLLNIHETANRSRDPEDVNRLDGLLFNIMNSD